MISSWRGERHATVFNSTETAVTAGTVTCTAASGQLILQNVILGCLQLSVEEKDSYLPCKLAVL